jgi:hypothetical protein
MWHHLVHEYEGLLAVIALLLALVLVCALPATVWLD